MPTTKAKNLIYRLALPFFSPSVPSFSESDIKGHALSHPDAFLKIIRRNHISGGAFYLQNDNESTHVFIKAVHTDQVPDDQTYFRVASITKMATALLSVRLMDLGLLDPEAPVASLLPDGKTVPELKGVLFSHLLSHTSGLADPPDLEKLLISKTPYTKAVSGCRFNEPGKIFRYSNLGFGLIGCIFEYVLNKPLGEIFREFLFIPLKMRASIEGCLLPEDLIMPVIRMFPYREGTSLRVTRLGRIPLRTPDPLLHYGHTAGSMYTDLQSLASMMCCIRDGGSPLLSPQYTGFMQIQKASYGAVSPTLSYGSGLLLIRDRRISENTVYGHQGFAYGCVDGAFWEDKTGNMIISLNGGCSEARSGRLGIVNLELCSWAFRKEFAGWK